jgi:energy-coupling factor transporter ATP-binding protein EcfA2
MNVWDTYPTDYRSAEVRAIVAAAEAGECIALVGLSGSGKSNLLGYIANRVTSDRCRFVLVDCNRLTTPSTDAFFRLIRHSLGSTEAADDELTRLDRVIEQRQQEWNASICLLLDRFDALAAQPASSLFSNLRSLRDNHKYTLTYVAATRRPLRDHTELAELFYAHVVWLGVLSPSDARWTVARYAQRKGLAWGDAVADALIALTRGYPSFLRAACEAYASGAALDADALFTHPAMRARLEEFVNDKPTAEELRLSGLDAFPWVQATSADGFDTTRLTAKEHLLLMYLQAHPNEVCEKDDLIRAVWSEDRVLGPGLRDDSLAQLVRRLREKIEPDPSAPRYIHTVPGRGYRYTRQVLRAEE